MNKQSTIEEYIEGVFKLVASLAILLNLEHFINF